MVSLGTNLARSLGTSLGTNIANSVPAVPMDVYIMLGDSEMAAGNNTLSETSGIPDCFPPMDSSLWMVDTKGLTLTPVFTECTLSAAEGTGKMIGWYRSRITGRRTCVVNVAKSSTNAAHFSYDTNPVSNFQKTIAAAAVALAVPGAVFAGFYLYGGANDGSLASPAWATTWAATIAAMRTAIGGNALKQTGGVYDAKVVYACLPDLTPNATYNAGGTSWQTVRSQMIGAQSSDWIMVTIQPTWLWAGGTQNNTNNNYGVHLDSTEQARSARLFATWDGASIPALPTPDPRTVDATSFVLDATVFGNSGGFVDTFTDSVNGKGWASTSTARPAYSASDALWNSRPSATYDGVNDLMDYSGALSDFACLHNGNGGTLTLAFRVTGANCDLFSTRVSGTFPGVLLRKTNGELQIYVYPASGSTAHAQIIGMPVTDGQRYTVQVRFKAGSLQYRLNGQLWRSAGSYNAGLPPSPLDPQHSKLGNQFGGYWFAGQIERAVLHRSYLSGGKDNQVIATMIADPMFA